MRNFKILYLWFSLSVIVGICPLFFYWAFIDGVYVNRVLNQDEIIYQTDKQAYKIGEPVFISTKGLCKYRDIAALRFNNIVDTISISYEPIWRSLPVGCVDDNAYMFWTTIPVFIPPATYHFTGYFQYDINPIRRGSNGIHVPFETNDFIIVE